MRPGKVRGTCEGSLGLLPPGSDPVRNLAAPRARQVYPRRRSSMQSRRVRKSRLTSLIGAAPGWRGGLPAKLTTAAAIVLAYTGFSFASAAAAAAGDL